MDYKDKRVAVIGLGISGKSAIRFLYKKGAKITLYDKTPKESLDGIFLSEFKDINLVLGEDEKPLNNFDLVVVGPGVKPINPLYKEALEKNIPIKNDINLFLDEWQSKGPVVGVTGSNGKSTIVSLLEYVLVGIGVPVKLGGNIGESPLDWPIDSLKKGTIIILELSSYQLELFDKNYFVDIAIISNISDNHLDRYDGSKSEYARTKMNILKNGHTKLITVYDDPGIEEFILPELKNIEVSLISFKEKLSRRGIYFNEGKVLVTESGKVVLDNIGNRKLPGQHNLYNITCVLEVLRLLDINLFVAEKYIRGFSGLDHRIQFIKEVDGVSFINDSKSTSPDALMKAFETVGRPAKTILISGGESKGVKYDSLSDYFKKYLRGLILLPGDAEEDLRKLAIQNNIENFSVQDMKEAVKKAKDISKVGDLVLLSPGTSSLNQFKGFEDRGEKFVEAINL